MGALTLGQARKVKVGTKLRIKLDNPDDYSYPFTANEEMRALQGKIITVTRIKKTMWREKSVYRFYFDGERDYWSWSHPMFELVTSSTVNLRRRLCK